MRPQSRQMALCGSLSALAVVSLLLGGLIPMATFCAPMLAMAVLLPILCECGGRIAGAAYGAAALLALLLTADREMALVYACFGWYPILRPHIARLRPLVLRFLAKLAVCNGLIAVLYGLLAKLFLGEAAGELAEASPLLTAAMLVFGNVTFLVLDFILARLSLIWERRLRRRFFRG